VALCLGEHQFAVVLLLISVAEGGEAVLIGAVLEEEVTCIFMYVLIFRGEGDVPLKIQEGLVGVAFNLQALGSFEVGFGVFLIEVDGNSEILDGLAEIAKDGKDEPPQVEIFGDVVFALFDGLIDIPHSLVEIIAIEMQHSPEIVKTRYMIIAQLRQMRNPNRQILNGFLKILIFHYRVRLALKPVLNYVESEVKVGLGFVVD
jgi:hypothetical protein